jgi:hypothetical protein
MALIIERAGQGCAIGSALFERIHQPYHQEGQRTGAFRFEDSRDRLTGYVGDARLGAAA